MIDEYLDFIQESNKSRTREWPEVGNFRKKNKWMWMYHGTPKENIPLIKRRGLKPSLMGSYNEDHFMFLPGRPLHGKKAIWFTSSKKYANAYSRKSIKAELFKKHRGQVILVKLSTNLKHLVFGFTTSLLGNKFDEYMYVIDIPVKDVLFPDDPKYYEIEKEFTYLKPWKRLGQ